MLSLMNEPLFDRYVYTVYPCRSGFTHHPLSKFGAQREALNCPSGGLSASTSMLGLSRRSLFDSNYIFRYDRLNGSFFFIKVQAITKNLVASLTRIFVRMPFSLSRPFRMLW